MTFSDPGVELAITPSPTPPPTSVNPAWLQASFEGTQQASLPPTATPAGDERSDFPGIDRVVMIPPEKESQGDQAAAWFAYSTGVRSYNPPQNHFVAAYRLQTDGFHELSRIELPDIDAVKVEGVKIVSLGTAGQASGEWLQVQGQSGAHGGCFVLLQYHDRTLEKKLSNCSSSPKAGELVDLNQDGVLEAALNWSDDYIFYYNCGVSLGIYQLWRWDGQAWIEILPVYLSDAASSEAQQLNNQAVDQAKAELWLQAQKSIDAALDVTPEDETVAWNASYIHFITQRRAELAAHSHYPLLSQVFLGDYEAALELMRPYKPRDLFGAQSPLITGTLATGREDRLYQHLLAFTEKALQYQPDLAPALFIRGWAITMLEPANREGFDLILEAAKIQPDETIFSQAAGYLR